MRIEYKRYRQEHGQISNARSSRWVLRNLHDATAPVVGYEALVDSGSDRNIFPRRTRRGLGY
jgi:hypothetical protein